MRHTFTIYVVVGLLSSNLHAAEPMVYTTEKLLYSDRDYRSIPDSGILTGWTKYTTGRHSLALTGVWLGKETARLGTKTYQPDVASGALAARIEVWGRPIGTGAFGTESFFHVDELIFVGDGYRHITKMIPKEASARSDAVMSLKSKWPNGIPKPEGLLLIPHGLLSTWEGSGGFLREVRSSKDDPQQLEAVLDLWDRFVRPVGYKPPDRQLVLTKGDEFEVKIVFRGGKRVVTPTSVGPGVTATGVGRIRCAGVYAPIPEKKFRGGVDLVPIIFIMTPVNK